MTGQDDKARAQRLAAALRENLKRRKAQARGRAEQANDGEPATNRAQEDRQPPARKPQGSS